MPWNQCPLLPQPRGGEVRRPVHAGCLTCELRRRPHRVGIAIVGRCLARCLRARDRRFQGQHCVGPLLRTLDAREAHHTDDIRAIPRAQRLRGWIGAEVILAIRQSESALHQEGNVGLLAVDALFHGQAQQARRSKQPPVEWIDVGAHLAPEHARQRELVVEAIDAVEVRLDGRQAPGLDDGLVHEGGAEIGNFARCRSHRPGIRVREELHDALARNVIDLVSRAPPVLAGRYRCRLEPAAIGVAEEVVARPDASVNRVFKCGVRALGGRLGAGTRRWQQRERQGDDGSAARCGTTAARAGDQVDRYGHDVAR